METERLPDKHGEGIELLKALVKLRRDDAYLVGELNDAIDRLSARSSTVANALEWHRQIVALASGWDEEGVIGPRPPLEWETIARMAMDYSQAALKEAPASATVPKSFAERCRPAVAHYMRTQERASYSEALSFAAKQAAKNEAAKLGKLLDEIDALIGGDVRQCDCGMCPQGPCCCGALPKNTSDDRAA